MIILNENTDFPDVSQATFEGLLAIGGNLSTKRLLSAYKKGIFPWFSDDEPILWWSPDPRFVLFPEELHVSKTMKQLLKKNHFEVTINKDFKSVIERCSKTKRVGQDDTWITQDMIDAYLRLHQLGYAKSIEVWQNDQLVGGLYGIDLGNNVFCGESMFTKVSNASKVGFITFVQNSNYRLIDCQLHTNHLESLGARNISRTEFVEYL
ncbi:MAG: leucyl/phenylalanyl-tRNA--protein transferase [Flavobacteriaceae bacterium]|uniref:leucyl/phenylalanyl-tRNA--protein transferase n=1 Tax=Winogradskyella sp. SYSU M77433 TaxID=3042722 RepID=UPI000C5AAA49|nr:leucyl/phenylalanyl-tRNA--protein transferase [Winogradskyella sp. SYSU M77433]MAX70902.1 leucyl/phenylalanyl-tRNA--protein transferase [Flavobacteriaceae bacterium]MDH7912166.1 leucyl/phenylalanyl-tRNA--protein transferase [Winogradskyella sp. SYSU M77433]|tara:strand:- start:144 stop:767 length:624 start_codon:yes stop_codon:yes gene_type:complete